MVVLQSRVPSSVPRIARHPDRKKDPKRDPNLKNYPYRTLIETLIVTLIEPQKGSSCRDLWRFAQNPSAFAVLEVAEQEERALPRSVHHRSDNMGSSRKLGPFWGSLKGSKRVTIRVSIRVLYG